MSDKVELLPCPFCGGNNLRIEAFSVQPDNYHSGNVHCEDCEMDGPSGLSLPAGSWSSCKEDGEADGVAAWNRRAALARRPAPAVPEGAATHQLDHVEWWANAYEQEGGHAVIVDMLRAYLSTISAAPTAPTLAAQEPVPVYLVLAEEDYEAPIVLRAFSDKGAAEGFAQALRDYQQDRPEWPVGDADLEEIQESDDKTRAWMAAHPGGEDAAWRRFFSVLPVPFSAAPPAAEQPKCITCQRCRELEDDIGMLRNACHETMRGIELVASERDTLRAEIERLQTINYRQEQQIVTLTADPNGWQAGYNKGRHDGTKTRLSRARSNPSSQIPVK